MLNNEACPNYFNNCTAAEYAEYRLYVIAHFKTLKVLDNTHITDKERNRAYAEGIKTRCAARTSLSMRTRCESVAQNLPTSFTRIGARHSLDGNAYAYACAFGFDWEQAYNGIPLGMQTLISFLDHTSNAGPSAIAQETTCQRRSSHPLTSDGRPLCIGFPRSPTPECTSSLLPAFQTWTNSAPSLVCSSGCGRGAFRK